jgi:hypothetical protein
VGNPLPKFTGALRKPIIRTDSAARLWLSMSEHLMDDPIRRERQDQLEREAIEEEDSRIESVRSKKMRLVAERLSVVSDGQIDWRALALKLAETFVPGLTVLEEAPRRGRPRGDKGAIYVAVYNKLQEGRHTSVKSACRALAKKGRWKGRNHETLAARYREILAAKRKSRKKSAT